MKDEEIEEIKKQQNDCQQDQLMLSEEEKVLKAVEDRLH